MNTTHRLTRATLVGVLATVAGLAVAQPARAREQPAFGAALQIHDGWPGTVVHRSGRAAKVL